MKRALEVAAEKQKDYLCIELEMQDELEFFQGHFIGNPIVPGATLLAWVVDYASEHRQTALYAQGMRKVKFQKPIQAGQRLRLAIQFDEQQRLTFTYKDSDEQLYASGIIDLARMPVDDQDV